MAIEPPLVDGGDWPGFELRRLKGPAGDLAVRVGGPASGPAVFLAHSILTSGAIWRRPAQRLAELGLRVICADTRGHGRSPASPPPYAMSDLAADVVCILDGLDIDRVHFIGVSLGGMTGLRLALQNPGRLASLCVIAARADAPAAFQAAWDERIDIARIGGAKALAAPTAERWFGRETLQNHAGLREALLSCIEQTSTEGFIGCARAIQGLADLDAVGRIHAPATLLVGSGDEGMLEPMRDLASRMPSARLEIIQGAGHLPQLDRPDETLAALLGHLTAHGLIAAA